MLRAGLTRLRPAAWPTAARRGVTTTTTATASTSGEAAAPALPYPRAAVAAVALRPTPAGPQALVVRRARPPHAGCWSFPGGSLELGETVVAGAARELLEECGVRFRAGGGAAAPGGGGGRGGAPARLPTLASTGPTPFTASDAIDVDPATGALRFHYAIVQVAGLVDGGGGGGGGSGGGGGGGSGCEEVVPVAGDDAAAVGWVDLADLAAGGEGCAPEAGGVFTPGCAAVAREALARFGAELSVLAEE